VPSEALHKIPRKKSGFHAWQRKCSTGWRRLQDYSHGVVIPLTACDEEQPRGEPRGEHISGIMSNERCNVVLTHVNADFDSFAGAVALAKLWSIERPALTTHVVFPRGVNPLVARFLAYHKRTRPAGLKPRAEQLWR